MHRGNPANGRERNPAEPTGGERRKNNRAAAREKTPPKKPKFVFTSAQAHGNAHTRTGELNKINLMANLGAASHSVGNLLRIRGRQHVIIQ